MKVLVFGGNGFLGAETVETLLDSGGVDVTVVNRGQSWDWDTPQTIKPRVKYIYADRDEPLSDFTELTDYVKGVHHDAVIDFSGFSSSEVRESVKLVAGRTDLYIYISSDSVYEVCQEKQHDGPSRETDAVRPDGAKARKKARRRDSYGDDKLSGEEVILEHNRDTGNSLPYLILRLADVVGPRDSTNRFWQYQLWLEMLIKYEDIPLCIPQKYEDSPLSFVYSKDVAKLIKEVIYMDKKSRESVMNQSYNLAFHENMTLSEILSVMERSLALTDRELSVLVDDDDDVPQIYPSVDRGPVDITKAVSQLNWTPTPLDTAFKTTVEFYRDIVKQKLFRRERKDVYRELKESLEDMFDKRTVKKHLKEILLLI